MKNNENEINTNETDFENTTEVVETKKEEQPKSVKREIFEWAEAIVIAVVAALLIRTFLFTLVLVDGSSMDNTLADGQRLFVGRLLYEPKVGDIVVFTPEKYPDKPFIKRVIATEGQTVDIDFAKGYVYVDGKLIDEPYIKDKTTLAEGVQFPITVPEGHFFAMGDNRLNSHDSRSVDVGDSDNQSGCISNERAMGKAMFRLWPLNKFGSIDE